MARTAPKHHTTIEYCVSSWRLWSLDVDAEGVPTANAPPGSCQFPPKATLDFLEDMACAKSPSHAGRQLHCRHSHLKLHPYIGLAVEVHARTTTRAGLPRAWGSLGAAKCSKVSNPPPLAPEHTSRAFPLFAPWCHRGYFCTGDDPTRPSLPNPVSFCIAKRLPPHRGQSVSIFDNASNALIC